MTRISPPTNPDDFDVLASEGEERWGLRSMQILDRGLASRTPAEVTQPNVVQQSTTNPHTMSAIDIEQLGFTKEELQERVIDRIVGQVMTGVSYDEDGNEFDHSSGFATKLNKRVADKIDETINAIAEKHVLPNVSAYIENLCLQETNKWGEKRGEPVTFVEYLIGRCEAYMQEQLNYDGKAKSEDSYSWKGTQTRLTYLVHKHLHYSIETAMKDALSVATNSIATGLQETVKLKLEEAAAKIKVSVATK